MKNPFHHAWEFLSEKYEGAREESELDWNNLSESNVEFGGAMEVGGGDGSISSAKWIFACFVV